MFDEYDLLMDDELKHYQDELDKKKKKLSDAIILNDPVKKICKLTPIMVKPGTTIRKALRRFQSASIGSLLVVENNKIKGIFTERDILMKIVGRGLNFDEEIVDTYMTPVVETLKESDPIAAALNKMYVGGFRHIPVVNEDDEPIAVVSVTDIIEEIAETFTADVINLPPEPTSNIVDAPEGG